MYYSYVYSRNLFSLSIDRHGAPFKFKFLLFDRIIYFDTLHQNVVVVVLRLKYRCVDDGVEQKGIRNWLRKIKRGMGEGVDFRSFK